MRDDTAAELVRLLTDISGQLTEARKHRTHLEEKMLKIERTVEATNRVVNQIAITRNAAN